MDGAKAGNEGGDGSKQRPRTEGRRLRSREQRWPGLLAEGLVIIVSILLALWGDAWWADRVDRIAEREMLVALHQEMVGNRSAIADQMSKLEEARARHRALVTMTPADFAGLPLDSINQVIRTPMFRAYTVNLAGDELNAAVGSGRLSLIRSPDVRSSLGAYQAVRGDVDEIGLAVFDLTVQARLALARLPGLAPWVARGANTSTVTAESLSRIRRDVEVMAVVAAKADLYNPFLSENERLRDAIDRVIAQLEIELGIVP